MICGDGAAAVAGCTELEWLVMGGDAVPLLCVNLLMVALRDPGSVVVTPV